MSDTGKSPALDDLDLTDPPGSEKWDEIADDLDIGDDLPDGRGRKGILEKFAEYESLPRDERILDKVSPRDYVGEWDPAEDDQLHRFIAMREAGFERDIDMTENHQVWLELTERTDCRQLGYKLHSGPGNFFEGPDHDFEEIVSLHRTKDWERLKELVGFDRADWPMEELGELIEVVREKYA